MSGRGFDINPQKRRNPPLERGPANVGRIAQWNGLTWVDIDLASAVQSLIDSGAIEMGEAGGSGTVESVALTMPKEFVSPVSGSPVTTTGTLLVELNDQTANQVWAGPTSGSPAEPSFRALVADDLPASALAAVDGLTDVPRGTISADRTIPTETDSFYFHSLTISGTASLTIDGTATLVGIS